MLSLILPFTTTRVQAATYLLGVCLFSISFLVFLNSSISFVITDRIGQSKRVGDAVGTLGFADELVALVACPVWGMLSDRIGVRIVTVAGYAIVGISFFIFAQASNVYPELLLVRLLFSIGGAATTTMVTAILPTLTTKKPGSLPSMVRENGNESSHATTPSISSEITITPARYTTRQGSTVKQDRPGASSSKLAGVVGMLTGCGALVALALFLPLPTRFQNGGATPSEAIAYSFYVVGTVALVVSLGCLFGLRRLAGEEEKGLRRLLQRTSSPRSNTILRERSLPSYPRLLSTAFRLGIEDVNIGLGYVGGFVARASSVAISLFIPLYVNAYFTSSGLCPQNPSDSVHSPGDIKRNCQRAYIVASMLTGVSQLTALVTAPLFGYLSSVYTNNNIPLLLASASGVAGYALFGRLKSPDPRHEDGTAGVFVVVALLGISQIGAIVCSLGSLSRGIETETAQAVDYFSISAEDGYANGNAREDADPASSASRGESSALLPNHLRDLRGGSSTRAALKGSIAGMYSLGGGAGILLLTKIGGLLFDTVDTGGPFFMMAIFNAVLFAVTLACDLWTVWHPVRTDQTLAGIAEGHEEEFMDDG